MQNIRKEIPQERVRAIIIEHDKLLLIKRVKRNETYWVLPGGGVEEQETREEALYRECGEELGVNVIIRNLFLDTVSDKPETSGQREFFYRCSIVNGTIGSGQGPEFNAQGRRRHSYDGEYKVLWVGLEELPEIDLRPTEVKDKIIEIM